MGKLEEWLRRRNPSSSSLRADGHRFPLAGSHPPALSTAPLDDLQSTKRPSQNVRGGGLQHQGDSLPTPPASQRYDPPPQRSCLGLGDGEEVRVSSRLDRHDTVGGKGQLGQSRKKVIERTRRGRDVRRRFRGRRWIQRKGGRGSSRAWRSTRAPSDGEGGSCLR